MATVRPDPSRRELLALGVILALAGCGGGGDLTTPVPVGTVEVATTTTGPSPDPDGYLATVDDSEAPEGRSVAASGTLILPALAPGAHRIGLAPASIASNCQVAGDNPRAVTVVEGDTTRVEFAIECTGPGTAPAITSVTGPPAADNAPGTSTEFTIGFTDPDGDLVRLTVVADSDPADAIEPDSADAEVGAATQGQTSGTVTYRYTCAATSPDLCGAGPVTLRFQLTDAAGHHSAPQTLALSFGIGNSPAITSVEAPDRTGTARGSRARIRLGYRDPDGDVRKIRIVELADTGDVLVAEGEIDVAAQAGTSAAGTLDLDFICRSRPGTRCAAGTASLRITLVDAESNTSRPRDLMLVFTPLPGVGTPPAITELQVPTAVSTAAGSRADFVVGFADPDGDLTTLRVEEVADPSAAFPGTVDIDVLDQANGAETGTVRTTLVCNVPAGEQCPAGRVTLRLSLVDAAGLVGAGREATIEFAAPTTALGGPAAGGAYAFEAEGSAAGEGAGNAKRPRSEAPEAFRR